jgi:hypothetical protein
VTGVEAAFATDDPNQLERSDRAGRPNPAGAASLTRNPVRWPWRTSREGGDVAMEELA